MGRPPKAQRTALQLGTQLIEAAPAPGTQPLHVATQHPSQKVRLGCVLEVQIYAETPPMNP